MKTTQHDNVLTMDDDCRSRVGPTDPFAATLLAMPVRHAIGLTRQWLVGRQQTDGPWDGQLEGNTTLNSEYVLLQAYLGNTHSDTAQQVAQHLIDCQLPGGGWSTHPTGKIDISASVKAYFALKVTGTDPGTEPMQVARRAILANGGADATDSLTRFYLALLDQISYDHCPSIPPEIVLLPRWLPISLKSIDVWTRRLIVPLSIVTAKRPTRKIDPRLGIRELFIKSPGDWPTPTSGNTKGDLSRLYKKAGQLAKWCQRHRVLPLRRRAMKSAERWVIGQCARIDVSGAHICPIVWNIVALGCQKNDVAKHKSDDLQKHLGRLIVEDELMETARLHPSGSMVCDTSLSICALSDSGLAPDNPTIGLAVDWLLAQQTNKPAGWSFDRTNSSRPNAKDTATALLALASQFADTETSTDSLPPDIRLVDGVSENGNSNNHIVRVDQVTSAIQVGTQWLVATQNNDGGWGPLNHNNSGRMSLVDRAATSGQSTPDLTGRVLEALGQLGHRLGNPTVDRAIEYLRGTQEANGSWAGRFGVNHIHGTWQAITGLIQTGVPSSDRLIATGVNWLLSCQHPSGGWGESPDSYGDPALRGHGTPTASQTSWALLGLLAADLEQHPAVIRGIQYLIDEQGIDGNWTESEFTGVGFPETFYLRYYYYPIYFPLMALSRWAVTTAASLAEVARPSLRIVAPEENNHHRAVGS